MRTKLLAVISLFALSTLSAQEPKVEKPALTNQIDSVSYIIGLNIGNGLKKDEIKINLENLIQGIKDGTNRDSAYAITPEAIQKTMMAFQQEMMKKKEEAAKVLGEKNKKAGEAFLAENLKKEGVKVTPSGLQYKILKSGKGVSPKATDKVKCHYAGTLVDGTEFDNSYKRGQPAVFAVTGVIKGWTEALQMMKPGDKWQLFIPSGLAYGERGRDIIEPNSTLIFEVELISVEK